jgi:hypothetical protein
VILDSFPLEGRVAVVTDVLRSEDRERLVQVPPLSPASPVE